MKKCLDFKGIFLDVKSFSPTNLKYMSYFYEMYLCTTNRPQAVDDLVAQEFNGSMPTIEEVDAELKDSYSV
jgi:hypothetical protein